MKSLIAWLFGFSYLKRVYQKYYNDPELKENFWNKTLNIFNIQYSILYSENIPENGGVIIVCNHPFGLVDAGDASLASRHLRPLAARSTATSFAN